MNKQIRQLALCAAMLGAPVAAWADFSGPYAPANWTTTLTGTPPGGGGTVDVSGAPASITLNGGNDVCVADPANPCWLDYTIAVPAAGMVSFDWSYQSNDTLGNDFDLFLVLQNGSAIQLSDDAGAASQSGSYSLPVSAGQVVGFRIDCTDCDMGAANVTISNFSGPLPAPAAAVQPVPTLEAWGMSGLMALLGWLGARRLRRQRAA